MVKIERISMISGKSHSMNLDITDEQIRRFEAREDHIQNIFPNLSAEEREFILTGITPEEWDAAFPEDDDDDDE